MKESMVSPAIAKALDKIDQTLSKLKSIAWAPSASSTLLSYINGNVDKGHLPITIVKSGQSVAITDLPTGLTSKEFVAIVTGSGIRNMVQLTTFGATSDQRTFFRDIYNGNWANDWQELALKSEFAQKTLTATTNTDGNIIISGQKNIISAFANSDYIVTMVFWFNGETYIKIIDTVNQQPAVNKSVTIKYYEL